MARPVIYPPTMTSCQLACIACWTAGHFITEPYVLACVGRSVGRWDRSRDPLLYRCIPSLAHGTLLTVTQKTRAGGWATMLLFRPNIVPICISLIFFTIKNYEQLIQDMQLIGLLMVDSYVAIYMPPLYHYTNKIN